MKYRCSLETTEAETVALLDLVTQMISAFMAAAKGLKIELDDEPEDTWQDEAPAPLEPFPEGEKPDITAGGDIHIVGPGRQEDTPDAYGPPLEFRVRRPRDGFEIAQAEATWFDFLGRWCSPFSSDLPDSEVQYPDRAAILEGISGTEQERLIKQHIAKHGTLNAAALSWLAQLCDGSGFSRADVEGDSFDLADKIAGSIAQLASIYMPELLVLFDISPSWRRYINEDD
jgi:hypothetical protein